MNTVARSVPGEYPHRAHLRLLGNTPPAATNRLDREAQITDQAAGLLLYLAEHPRPSAATQAECRRYGDELAALTETTLARRHTERLTMQWSDDNAGDKRPEAPRWSAEIYWLMGLGIVALLIAFQVARHWPH